MTHQQKYTTKLIACLCLKRSDTYVRIPKSATRSLSSRLFFYLQVILDTGYTSKVVSFSRRFYGFFSKKTGKRALERMQKKGITQKDCRGRVILNHNKKARPVRKSFVTWAIKGGDRERLEIFRTLFWIASQQREIGEITIDMIQQGIHIGRNKACSILASLKDSGASLEDIKGIVFYSDKPFFYADKAGGIPRYHRGTPLHSLAYRLPSTDLSHPPAPPIRYLEAKPVSGGEQISTPQKQSPPKIQSRNIPPKKQSPRILGQISTAPLKPRKHISMFWEDQSSIPDWLNRFMGSMALTTAKDPPV